jgi:hypothetical protein
MKGGCGHGEQVVQVSPEEVAAYVEGTWFFDVLASAMKLVIRRQNSLFLLLILNKALVIDLGRHLDKVK